jgi:hypothetical protein
MKTYGGVDVWIHIFLISALAGGKRPATRPCRFTPMETDPGTHWLGGWVNPRAGLDDVVKWIFLTLPALELRPLGRPARSQSLYQLRFHFPAGTEENKTNLRIAGIQGKIQIEHLSIYCHIMRRILSARLLRLVPCIDTKYGSRVVSVPAYYSGGSNLHPTLTEVLHAFP